MLVKNKPATGLRADFETWYVGSHTNTCILRGPKGYIDETTRVAWRAYQAGHNHRGAQAHAVTDEEAAAIGQILYRSVHLK